MRRPDRSARPVDDAPKPLGEVVDRIVDQLVGEADRDQDAQASQRRVPTREAG